MSYTIVAHNRHTCTHTCAVGLVDTVSRCPCENTHGTPSAYCMCRIGLCARDYARVMVGMVLT